MIRLKAYRYRVYPTAEQEALFRQTAGSCRFVYNLCLEQRKLEYHRSHPRRLTAYDQIAELPALKVEASWLQDVPNHPLQQAVIDLDKAFRNFFEGRASYPQFRRRGDRDSFRYPDPKQFKPAADRIFLPKAGWVDWVQHRPMEGRVKTATVSREADCWYVSLQCEIEMPAPVPNLGPVVGIDMGIAKPMALSTGQVIQLLRTTDKERHKLATLQRKVARKTKGSRNQAKARVAAARFQARLAAAEGCRAQGHDSDSQEPRRHCRRGPEGAEHDGECRRHDQATGPQCACQGRVKQVDAGRGAVTDQADAGVQGGMVRRAGHCHKPGVYQSEMQRVRPCPCRQQGQSGSVSLPGVRPRGQR
jgi:hypothetical protein